MTDADRFSAMDYMHEICEQHCGKESCPVRINKVIDYDQHCPRCGKAGMRTPIHTNAISRASKSPNHVYVCELCGAIEAVIVAFNGKKSKWVTPVNGIMES